MLTVNAIGSTKEEVSYYASLGKSEQHDYYAKGDDRQGVWWGAGAKRLSLSGEVTPEAFANLLKGYSADGKRNLVQNAGEKSRRAAFDLTWSAPKSVSAAWANADAATRRKIEECLELALRAALDHFAKECGVTRRGKAGMTQETAGLIAAIFRHDTSRPVPGQLPDANLHFHVVLANACVREDGTTGAFDARPLFKKNQIMALGALFRAEASRALLDIGLSSHRPTKPGREDQKQSWFELDVAPPPLLEAMSKRRSEIKAYLAKRGLSGAGAKEAERAALITRGKKTAHTRAELDAAWQELGKKHGLTKEMLSKLIASHKREEKNLEALKWQALNRAVDRLMEDRAHFTELELMRFTAEEAQTTGIGVKEVVSAVKTALEHRKDLVRLKADEDGEVRYTTKAMLAIEKRAIDSARLLHRRSGHAVSFEDIRLVEKEFPTLRDEQKAALRHMTSGSDIACVNGVAGSGKTYLLEAARCVFEKQGFMVIGTALAAKAARGLEEGSGIASLHIHKLLYDVQAGKLALTDKTVLVVDEAGMVGTKHMEKLLRLVEANGAKLVLVGDHRQLQAISAGSPFRYIAEKVGVVELNQIIRQKEAWAREVVYQFRDGKAIEALESLQKRGRLTIGDTRDKVTEMLASDWMRERSLATKPEDLLVFAGTNLEVQVLNAMCQAHRKKSGELGEASVEVQGSELHVGDRVVATKNNAALLVQNGMLGEVTAISGRTIQVQFDSGYQVKLDLEHYDSLSLAYALSTHKGQGVTTENSFVLVGGSMTDRELTYVQASRARGSTRVYCDRVTAGEELSHLASEMSRSRQKDMAHEYLLEEVA